MTRQEVAVALSHIETWKLVATGDVPCALVLEDDVFFSPRFARNLQRAWSAVHTSQGLPEFDLLYLAFRDLHQPAPNPGRLPLRRMNPGVWEASGYVLTRSAARELLGRLPVYGPIDLWLNLQFSRLRVYTVAKPIIEQRIDEPSTNAYSVLPVLSQVGVITREKPLVPELRRLSAPIVAFGPERSGLTALAKALSMVGYTCLSDINRLAPEELRRLRTGQSGRAFNAYVNVGSLTANNIGAIARANPQAGFISTSPNWPNGDIPPEMQLTLDDGIQDRWAALAEFLKIDYPSFPYPEDDDIGCRIVIDNAEKPYPAADLKFDRSPWILNKNRRKRGALAIEDSPIADQATTTYRPSEQSLDAETWRLRDDTFPSNLAIFTPTNFTEQYEDSALLTLRQEPAKVREYTSAALASRHRYLYGRFGAELRPSDVSGLITGIFLHRNGPRQEIDIEFLGKDPTKMLTNVYYNPGPDGAKLEFGYRGTPTQIDLGFNAARTYHYYEIDWRPESITWRVDGAVVYRRNVWDPTPIPDQPLEFNVNLWYSRSTRLAGSLSAKSIPATVRIRSIEISTSPTAT